MPAINEDRKRQVVPRWRSFTSTAEFGELKPLVQRPAGAFTKDMLEPLLEDWQREPGLSVAADFVSAAYGIGFPDVAREAAAFVLENEKATQTARAIAAKCLGSRQPESPSEFMTRDESGIRLAISQHRKRLGVYPLNPVRWTNLSLLYTTYGQHEKARRAMLAALGLAPHNRFVVRAASRLFLHQGDLDRAQSVLLRSPAVQTDPWILAGEIATAAVRGQSSRFVKRAHKMLDNAMHAPFHLSELAAALATLESDSGNRKKARRFGTQAMVDPAENAVAQAAWLNRQLTGATDWEPPPSAQFPSSEANAWVASIRGEWQVALEQANRWQAEQPFSSRPAIFGGFIACSALEDFREAERIVLRGLQSNRDDATLYNNLAFARAQQGKIEEAQKAVAYGWDLASNQRHKVSLTATKGLIAFRSGDFDRGRTLYLLAIRMADREPDLAAMATIYFAIEELRARSSFARQAERRALEAVEKLQGAFQPVFRGKLEHAHVQRNFLGTGSTRPAARG